MAYGKRTWTNDRNHRLQNNIIDRLKYRSTRETNGDSSLAVDGIEEPLEWSKCATIDNYFVDKPLWMVDLGRGKNVAGVMLRTWHESKNINKIKKSCKRIFLFYIHRI